MHFLKSIGRWIEVVFAAAAFAEEGADAGARELVRELQERPAEKSEVVDRSVKLGKTKRLSAR